MDTSLYKTKAKWEMLNSDKNSASSPRNESKQYIRSEMHFLF